MLHPEDWELDAHLSRSSTSKLVQGRIHRRSDPELRAGGSGDAQTWRIHRCSDPELRAGGSGDAQTWPLAGAAQQPLPALVVSPDPLEK